MTPLVKEPPKQAIAAIPMGSPVSPSMAVRAMELRGDVQIILITPPSRSPMRMGDCSVAAEIMPPMCARAAFTAGSTRKAMNLAIGAIMRAPSTESRPGGRCFSINGAMKPIAYPAINPGRMPYPPRATPATTANTGFTPMPIGTIIAAATPPMLPDMVPVSPRNAR